MNAKKRVALVLMTVLFISILLVGCSDYDILGTDTSSGVSLLKTDGKLIKNANGEEVYLRGTNAGGWLVQESWMCPSDISDAYFCQKLMMNTLTERFGEKGMRDLLAIYEDNWWTEEDFDNIKEVGFNVIRLPFTYMNLTDSTGGLYEKGFERLKWFVDECTKRNVYVILDMHGAFGSQSGYEHSGDNTQYALYTSEKNMTDTLNLWIEVARRFVGNATVAGYDLLNEPLSGYVEGNTGKVQWDYFDRLLRGIREVDPDHIIFINGTWEPSNLPKPSQYGWTNVVYEFHNYKWKDHDDASVQKAFVNSKLIRYKSVPVPVLVGEFTAFGNMDSWKATIEGYSKGHHWTTWTYKIATVNEDYNNNWGLYCSNMARVNVKTDSYEEIATKWSKCKTSESFRENTQLTNFFKSYKTAKE